MTRNWRVSRFDIATERTKYRQNLRPDGDCATQSRVSGEATARIADRRKCSEKGNSGPDSVSRSSSWCNCISTALYDPASAAVEPLSRFDPTPVGTHVSSGSATGSRTTTRLRGPEPSVFGGVDCPDSMRTTRTRTGTRTPDATHLGGASQYIRNRMAGVSKR